MVSKADARSARILDAFMARLASEGPYRIDLAQVASDAGIGLSELRREFSGVRDLLSAQARRIDLLVLEGDDPAMADEPGRDRLFDVLMRRLDALSPHREAVRRLLRACRRDPALTLVVARHTARSMTFMLAAAGLPSSGPSGLARAAGLAAAWPRIVSVWLDDTDPGLARTMAALDRDLSRGDMLLAGLSRLKGAICAVRTPRARRAGGTPDQAEAAT